MKALIVYYSLEGNTKMIANELAAKLGADTLELKPIKAYPTGKVSKFLWGGKSSVMSDMPILEPIKIDIGMYDTIILGTPVWASRCSPPLRTFLMDRSVIGKKVAAFACAGGNSPGKTFDILEQLCNKKLCAKTLFVDPASGKDPAKDAKLSQFAETVSKEV